MSVEQRVQRRVDAASEFDRHEQRSDGVRVVGSLADGLSMLRDLLFARIHEEGESGFGQDSMLLPVSVVKSEAAANKEIEIYLIAESAADAVAGGYVNSADAWFQQWLGRLRLGDYVAAPAVVQRLNFYADKSPDDRRRGFSSQLQQALPEAGRAPLVLYRLLPLAVSIVTAMAFGDQPRAEATRKRQIHWLASIADCHSCHGRLLDIGENCAQCGNPFWKHDWLTAE